MNANILIIDDDDSILEILERWLQDSGYTSVFTASENSMICKMLEKKWDLIISDVYLPDINGIKIAQQIRARHPQSRIMLMTGHVTTEVTLKALDHQVDGFLPKPMGRASFLEKVKMLLLQGNRPGVENQKERVLAIGAHPDDVEIGCGGILLQHRDVGDDICILTLSPGQCGGEQEQRSNEALQAAQMLRARLVMENLEDTRISEGSETISIISKAVEAFQPTTIYTHTVNDSHQDHRNTSRATIVSARGIARLQFYQSPSSTISFSPSRFVDITDSLQEKQELLSCYRSQKEKCDYLSNAMIASTAQYWGRFAGFKQIEPLEVMRTV